MNKLIISIIVVALVAYGAIAMTNKKEEIADKTVITIGASLPLSGEIAYLGEPARQGLEMALEEINIQSTKYIYKLIVEDDQFDSRQAATTANKLITVDKVDVIMSIGSGTGNTISPIAERYGVPHIAIASDQRISDGDYNFIHYTPPYKESEKFVEELQKRNITKLALVGVSHPGWVAVIDAFKEDIVGTDIELVVEKQFNTGETDFRTIASQVLAQEDEFEYLFIGAFSPELELVTRQIREIGITKPITSIEAIDFTKELELFEGSWYAAAAVNTDEFNSRYESKYGTPPGPGTANSYDIMHLVKEASEKIEDNPTRAQIKDKIYTIKNFSGALGSISVDSDGLFVTEASIKEVIDGKVVVIE